MGSATGGGWWFGGLVLVLVNALVAGCSGGKDGEDGIVPDGGTDTDTDTLTTPPHTGDTGETLPTGLVVTADNVYGLTIDYTLAIVELRASWDALVSWDAVTVDLWGAPLAAATVPELALLEVLYDPSEIEDALARDDLDGKVLSTWTADVDGTLFAHLSDLAYGAIVFDPVTFMLAEPDKTWVLALVEPDGDRLNPLAMVGLDVQASGGDTAVTFDDSSSALTWSAAFDGIPLSAAADAPADAYTVDWEALTVDAFGKPYDPDLGSELFIGRFAVDPASLGAEAYDLAGAASGWWTMDVGGDTDARLSLARDAYGGPFGGFTGGSQWVIGVRCEACLSPLPLWAAVVEVQ